MAAMSQLDGNSRLGLRTSENTLHPGFTATQSSTALRDSWTVASETYRMSLSCEFGACGGGTSSFQQQNPSTNPQVSLLPPLFLLKLRDLYPWNWGGGDSNLVPGTHYCGPGGWGQPTGKVDIACQAHDLCYNNLHINAAMNVLGIVPDSAKAGQAACDQQLCSTISSSRLNQLEMGQALAVQSYFGCH